MKKDSFCLTLWDVLYLEVAPIPREVQSSLCEETLRRGLGQQTALGTRHMDKVASGCSCLALKTPGWGPRMVKHSPCSYCDLSELLTHGFWVCNRWLLDEPQWLPSCNLGVASSGTCSMLTVLCCVLVSLIHFLLSGFKSLWNQWRVLP